MKTCTLCLKMKQVSRFKRIIEGELGQDAVDRPELPSEVWILRKNKGLCHQECFEE